MSQDIWSAINPDVTTGTMLAGILGDFKDALMTGCAGTARPANLQAGGMWIDTTNQGAPNFYWSFKIYTGSGDQEVFRLSVLNGFGGTLFGDSEFDVSHISDDTIGPILQLIKNRIDDNAQVLGNDTVAELRFIGCTSLGLAQTPAYIRFTATDDQTSSAFGGTLSFASTPDATNAITEHFRFINACIETVKSHKINSQRLVSQNIATTATIAALDASKVVAEMTGATNTDIQGIDTTKDSQLISVHNRSTATVTLKHQSSSALAANRLKLPAGQDIAIIPGGTATLYYCVTDAFWKIISLSASKPSKTVVGPFLGINNSFTVPTGKTKIRVTGRYRVGPISCKALNASPAGELMRDPYGNLYSWGDNESANLGNGDLPSNPINRSSPVAVLGALVGVNVVSWQNPVSGENVQTTAFAISAQGDGYAWGSANAIGDGSTGVFRSVPVAITGKLKFSVLRGTFETSFGLTPSNILYSWGIEAWMLANGTTNCSSPVAVLGGLKFADFQVGGGNYSAGESAVALAMDGTAYVWGFNSGQFGNAATSTSSPIAVLGGLKFVQILQNADTACMLAIDVNGQAYAWGTNAHGQLGLGDVTPRSSPVAVLGGISFKRIYGTTSAWFGLATDGTAYAWGLNTNDTLGLGDTIDRSSPVAVLGGVKFTELFPRTAGCFGKAVDGTLYAWGTGGALLGIGSPTSASSPVAVLGGLKFEYFICNDNVAHGVTSDGTVYSWGTNASGSLGVGDTLARSSPVAIVGAVSAGLRKFGPVEIDVVPGTTYPIKLNMGNCFFGNTLLDTDLDQVTIEYN